MNSRGRADLARHVMEFDALNQASHTRKCEKDALHLSLSWRTGEAPSRAEMEAAAHEALASIGMANAKALFVAHTDEAHAHLHIVASRINPATGRAYDLKENYLRLSAWAEDYEQRHGGIVCQQRAENNVLRRAIADRNPAVVADQLTGQRATFTAKELNRTLAKAIRSPAARKAFAAQILAQPHIVALSDYRGGPVTRYTTQAVLDDERRVLQQAAALAADRRHGVPDAIRDGIIARYPTIRDDQRDAFERATEASGLSLIDGQAGTGNSFTMKAIREAYEAAGYSVTGLAPTNAVAGDMRRDGFSQAGTIHAALFALKNGRRTWDTRSVIIADEAGMVGTKLLAELTRAARDAGAKLILIGDDRQLASIERGGMFGALREQHGAASLTHVTRQHSHDDRRAASAMAEGRFHDALKIFEDKGNITWSRSRTEARAALIETWKADNAVAPGLTRFVFAYTNADVARLNSELRAVRRERGELGSDHLLPTKDGPQAFAVHDRIQFTGTDKELGLANGVAGTVQAIDGTTVTVRLDGKQGEIRRFDAAAFQSFQLDYAGTIYKGQGRTLDQSYLFHTEHWRSAASYVALTRHRDRARLFVDANTARDIDALARQMGRRDETRAASQFHRLEQENSPAALDTATTPPDRLGRSVSLDLAQEIIAPAQPQPGFAVPLLTLPSWVAPQRIPPHRPIGPPSRSGRTRAHSAFRRAKDSLTSIEAYSPRAFWTYHLKAYTAERRPKQESKPTPPPPSVRKKRDSIDEEIRQIELAERSGPMNARGREDQANSQREIWRQYFRQIHSREKRREWLAQLQSKNEIAAAFRRAKLEILHIDRKRMREQAKGETRSRAPRLAIGTSPTQRRTRKLANFGNAGRYLTQRRTAPRGTPQRPTLWVRTWFAWIRIDD